MPTERATAVHSSPSVPSGWLVRMILGLTLVLGLIGALHVYIGARLISGFGLDGPAAALGWALAALLFVSLPLGMAAGRVLPRPLALGLQWLSYLWMAAFGLMLTTVLATDLLRWVVTAADPTYASHASTVQAWAILAVSGPGIALGLYRARKPVVERRDFEVSDLGAGLDGLKIVQLTDVHIGETLDRRFLEGVVAKVNALAPDVVVITGDLVDGSVTKLREELRPLADLRAPLGRYYVTGNHEYYHGGAVWERELERLGFTALRNAHRVIERDGARLAIAGIPDLEARRLDPENVPDVGRALAGVPAEVPRVLLAHQPRAAALVGEERVDLQLSGHTHGGQIFPFMFFVRLQQPVVAGLHRLGKVWVYTSRGTGYWGPPVRLGAPPEIAEVTLRAQTSGV